MRSGLPRSSSQGCSAPGMRRFETVKPTRPGLGLGAAAGRALVADLAARAGRRARERRDRGRVVVRLDLHQDVDRLVVTARTRRRPDRREAAPARASLRSPRRCRCRRTARRADCVACVLRIMSNSDLSLRSPSTIQSALKILCRQCSQFACANIISSTSVGSRPSSRKACVEVVDLVVRQREAQLGVGALERRTAARPAAAPSPAVAARRARTAPRPRRASCSTLSVMRSCSSGADRRRTPPATAAGPPAAKYAMPRSMRRTAREPADVRDVGGLARPRRDRAEARHHQHRLGRRGVVSGARGP